MFTLKEFGNRISMLRKLQNLTQDELAERIHVTSTDYLLTGTGPANDFAKEQLLSAIEVLSSVSKLI